MNSAIRMIGAHHKKGLIMLHITRAQLALQKFTQKYPTAGTITVTKKNEKGRWVRSMFDEHDEHGTAYRFQARNGRYVQAFEIYTIDRLPDEHQVVFEEIDEDQDHENDGFDSKGYMYDTRPAHKNRAGHDEQATLNLIEPPAPVISDPWLDLFRQRMERDEQRIQELHQANLKLVDSVSSHHQGATGPLVKLIDQLARGLAKVHADKIEHLDRQSRDLRAREEYVETAEETAETRLINAEEKQRETQNESAIIQGVMQHIAPQILENLTK